MSQALPIIASAAPDQPTGFGALTTDAGVLPLRAMDVAARITGLAYTVRLEQTFVNTLSRPLEATYVFPLPSRAAVTTFRLRVADRTVDGVLKERGQARRDYDRAVAQGYRAALAEEDRPDLFSIKVGNVMPGEEARVELELVGQLSYLDGEAEFRFPLVVAPRYISGLALPGVSVGDGTQPDTDAVPDASRVTPPVLLPGFPNPVRLSLTVDIDAAGLPVDGLQSSLHAVAVQQNDGNSRVTLYPGERLNRDFILRFKVAGDAVRSSVVTVSDTEDPRAGTFMLTLVPPAQATQRQTPRDVVFVLDRSGSMQGWKMVCARRALARMVDTLNDADRFAVIAFDNRTESPPGHGAELVSASDRERFRAAEWLAGVEARGGTEMAQPLLQGVGLFGDDRPERDRILVLLTDGQVGGEDQILQHLGARLRTVRVFTLGVDRAVNEGFLRRLAQLGGGACELVESEDRLDEVLERTQRRIATPVVSDLSLKLAGADAEPQSITPGRLPDLVAGAPVIIYGRYRAADEPLVVYVKGRTPTGEPWAQDVAVAANRADARAPALLWARSRIRDLEDRFAIAQDTALEREILDISLGSGVLCRFTAFVAVDRSEVANPGGETESRIQPAEPVEGWSLERDLLAMPFAAAPLPMAASAATAMEPPVAGAAPVGQPALSKRRATGGGQPPSKGGRAAYQAGKASE